MSKRASRDKNHESSTSWSLASVWRSLKGPTGAAEESSVGRAAAAEGAHAAAVEGAPTAPAEGTNKIQLEEMLLLLHRTYSTVSDSAIFSERRGVSFEGWVILREIGPDGGTVTQIMRKLRISRRRVTKAMAELADRGLIEVSQSGEDRGPHGVAILPKGSEMLSQILSQLKSLDHGGTERLFDRDRRVFNVVLRTLSNRKKPAAADANREPVTRSGE